MVICPCRAVFVLFRNLKVVQHRIEPILLDSESEPSGFPIYPILDKSRVGISEDIWNRYVVEDGLMETCGGTTDEPNGYDRDFGAATGRETSTS